MEPAKKTEPIKRIEFTNIYPQLLFNPRVMLASAKTDETATKIYSTAVRMFSSYMPKGLFTR